MYKRTPTTTTVAQLRPRGRSVPTRMRSILAAACLLATSLFAVGAMTAPQASAEPCAVNTAGSFSDRSDPCGGGFSTQSTKCFWSARWNVLFCSR